MDAQRPSKQILLTLALVSCFWASAMAQSGQRGFGAFNCDSFCVVSIVFDTAAGDSLYVTIANNDTNFIDYPVVQLIDTAGDTVANAAAYFYYYGQLEHSVQTYQIYTTLTSFPANWHGKIRLSEGGTNNACIINYSCSQTTSAIGELVNNNFTIYPNPANDELNISGLFQAPDAINLCDVTGRIVLQWKVNSTVEKISVNIAGLQNGIYFLELCTGNNKAIRKIAVNK